MEMHGDAAEQCNANTHPVPVLSTLEPGSSLSRMHLGGGVVRRGLGKGLIASIWTLIDIC
jgi:hypothetical protein